MNRLNDDLNRFLSVLCCPRCGTSLGLHAIPKETEEFSCLTCREAYLHHDGVLGLFYADSTWFWALHEVLALQDLAVKALTDRIERDRREVLVPCLQGFMDATTAMSDQAIATLPSTKGEILLEPGAGSCTHAKKLSDMGYSVIAVDLNPLELLAPRNRLELRDLSRFHASYFEEHDHFKKEEIRFLRVVADLSNLPFQSGTIGLVYSRSVLHHIEPLVEAISEVGRVMRPGGTWAAAGEPTASILDLDPWTDVEWSIDYEEGLHERMPRILDYLRGFRAGHLKLQGFTGWHGGLRIALGSRGNRGKGYRYSGPNQFPDGPWDVPLHRLLWMNCIGNFKLRRKAHPWRRNRQLDPGRKRFLKPEWLFFPDKYRAELNSALRRMFPIGKLMAPAELVKLPFPEIQIKGFRASEWAEGRPVRYTTRSASVFLPPPRSDGKKIRIDYFQPTYQPNQALRARLQVNEIEVGILETPGPGPRSAEFEVPFHHSADIEAVEVRLTTEGSWWDSAGRELGLAVERVSYSPGCPANR